MPELKHAELLNGVVFLSASRFDQPHSEAHFDFNGWLWLYSEAITGLQGGTAGTWLMGAEDVPQPDLTLRILPEYGGQSNDQEPYPAGAPELIVEISGSSSSRDLGIKLDLYRRAGVREYIEVLLRPRQVIWRVLARGRYKELAPGDDGLLRSVTFPGLWLDPAAAFDRGRSLRPAVELGLRSPEHAAFAAKLAKPSPRRRR